MICLFMLMACNPKCPASNESSPVVPNLTGNINEEKFTEYLDTLALIPKEQVKPNMTAFLDKEVKRTGIISLFERYLNAPQSPYKNEEWYIIVLEYALKSPKVDETSKIKAQAQLKILYKNRLGNAATDFTFTNLLGQKGSLYHVKAPYTLVLFYDPDCEYCRATILELKNDPLLKKLQQRNALKVLAVYTEGNNKLWQDYKTHLPSQWINVSVVLQNKYDLPALPSLYLLDQDKKVLLKDTPVEKLQDYLMVKEGKGLK